MKNKIKILALFVAIIIVFVSVSSCVGKYDIPFITTKPAESTTSNVVTITFPEGYTVMQYADLLAENGVCSKTEFLEACKQPIDGISVDNADERVFFAEGYLFPDTYEFYLNSTVDEVISKFVENFQSKITDDMVKQAQDMGYTLDEILTLASIIQKECDEDADECANVSSVFHNRLNQSRNCYLGSDVTYFYLKNMADYLGGAYSENFDKLLTYYYTYSGYRRGLPVGAICNPGLKAINAALNPADTDYLFFLTDESGKTFYYAKTSAGHQANAVKAGLTK